MAVTEKLYYHDPSLLEFDASIREYKANGALHEVVLDRTSFFPGGGGQPADRGMLGNARVVDVNERDDEIVHVVDAALRPGPVHGSVDADRRLDFMAQHTGEHILAQALFQAGGLSTVSVHFGEETTTIELANPEASDDVLRRAEEIANTIVKENRKVIIHEVDHGEASRFPLRRKPPDVGRLRIVEIEGFDWVGCSGVHVPSTGDVFLIKLVGQEKIRGHARIHAIIGARALADYGRKVAMTQALIRILTCGEESIVPRVEELVRSARESERELGRLRLERAAADAEASVPQGKSLADALLIRKDLEGAGPAYLKAFTERIVASPGRVVVAVDRSRDGFQWIVAHSLGARIELPPIITPLLSAAGAKGGGRGAWMQGAGPSADSASQFANAAEAALVRVLS